MMRKLPMAGTGSLLEGQEFFRIGIKPKYRFRDRAPARLMTGGGWQEGIAEV